MTIELPRVHNAVTATLARFSGSALLVALGRVAFLAFFAVAARFTSTSAFGEFATSLALAQILAIPATLGTAPAAQSILPQAFQRGRAHVTNLFLHFSATATLLGTTATAIALLTTAGVANTLAPDGNLGPMAIGALALLPCLALGTLREFVARSSGHLLISLLPRDVIWTLACILAVVTLPQFSASLLVGSALLLLTIEIIATAMLAHKLGYRPTPLRPFKRWRSRSLALLLNNTGGQLLDRFDLFIVGMLFSLDIAALYAVANRLAPLASLSQRFIIPVLAAPLSLALARRDWPRIRAELRIGVILGAACAGVVLVTMALAHQFVLGLFGAPYLAASSLLLLLTLGQASTALGSNFGLLLALGPRAWELARLMWLTVLPSMGLAFIAGPLWGPIGVAATATGALILYNMLIARAALSTLPRR